MYQAAYMGVLNKKEILKTKKNEKKKNVPVENRTLVYGGLGRAGAARDTRMI